jgi:phosphatidylserine/phosphatidylglycerophosphate/cardiolipin synthase-like enzyme
MGVKRKAALHAKCVVIDGRAAFVSSANFTEAAQERNIEVGVLVRSEIVAERLINFFAALISTGAVRQVL